MIAADKAAATGLSLATLLPAIFNAQLTMPVLGVGSFTVLGAAFGAAAALGYDDNRPPRGRMFVHTMSTIIISCLLVGVMPRALGWAWATGPTEAALAGLTSLVLYYSWPMLRKKGRELLGELKLSDILDLLPWRRSRSPQLPPPEAPPPGDEDRAP